MSPQVFSLLLVMSIYMANTFVLGFAFWKICERTGLSKGIVAAVILLPGLGILIGACVVAYADWPAQPLGGRKI